jgi:phage terminase large subunit GpA-like protein
MMDAAVEPGIHTVVYMTSAQVAKSECLHNILCHWAIYKGGPMMIVQPTIELGERWSKKRLSPMIRDTACLHEIFGKPGESDFSQTIMEKDFRGGFLFVTGANSPTGLAGQPAGILIGDEVNRWPRDVGKEGDPLKLALKRLTAYPGSLAALASTPTNKGDSRIETEFLRSDQRRFYVQCPRCEKRIVFDWENMEWEGDDVEAFRSDTVRYICQECGGEIIHTSQPSMVRNGEWRATSTSEGVAGFAINELYSQFRTWPQIAKEYLEVKDSPRFYKSFVNLVLGESYEDDVEALDDNFLMARRESYDGLPDGVGVITAGVDVHSHDLHVVVVGWGEDYESWGLSADVLHGDTNQPEVWKNLRDYLKVIYGGMTIVSTAVDTGYRPDRGYFFAKNNYRVHAVKGMKEWGRVLVDKKTGKAQKYGVKIHRVGVKDAKVTFRDNLKIMEPGSGYCHFPHGYEQEYFQQITAQVLKTEIDKNGIPVRNWVKQPGRADHFLDCNIYAMAALGILGDDVNRLVKIYGRSPKREAPEINNGGSMVDVSGGGSWLDS